MNKKVILRQNRKPLKRLEWRGYKHYNPRNEFRGCSQTGFLYSPYRQQYRESRVTGPLLPLQKIKKEVSILAIVNMLKFSNTSGAMICDEEAVYFERRRTHFDENIRNLLTPEISERLGLEAFYGGAGYPPFHYEVVRRACKAIEKWAQDRTSGTLEEVARITLECIQQTIHRKVDDKLRFYFGFDLDQLNQGFYKKNDEKIEITQDCIKENARKMSDTSAKAPHIRNIYDNEAVVMGFDPVNGFQAYVMKGNVTVMSFLRGFESVGKGKYGSGVSFGKTFDKKFLSERRAGYNRVEGMILLLASAIEAKKHFIDIGGYFSISYIDGDAKNPDERRIEVLPHRVKLAEETVYAHLRGFLDKQKTEEIVEKLIFGNTPVEELEDELFASVEDQELLEFILRGYKIDPENLREDEKALIEPSEQKDAGNSSPAKKKKRKGAEE